LLGDSKLLRHAGLNYEHAVPGDLIEVVAGGGVDR
jgi:hypothetical protein